MCCKTKLFQAVFFCELHGTVYYGYEITLKFNIPTTILNPSKAGGKGCLIKYSVLSNSYRIRVNHVFQNDQFSIDFPLHLSSCNANPAWCRN